MVCFGIVNNETTIDGSLESPKVNFCVELKGSSRFGSTKAGSRQLAS